MEEKRTGQRKEPVKPGLFKRKSVRIGIAAAAAVLILAIVLLLHGKGSEGSAPGAGVRSAVVERGTIQTTVEGTGTLESASETEICIPDGVEIEKILVEEGDTVEKGQKLAKLNKASVAAKLLEVTQELENVEDEIDDLSEDANDSSTTEYLRAQVLSGELSNLKKLEKELKTLLSEKVVKASCAGVVSGLGLSDDAETEDGSGEETTAAKLREVDFTKISKCEIAVVAPVTGEKPQEILDGGYEGFTGTISWNCSTETFQADTVYTATITLTAADDYEFSDSILPTVKGADVVSRTLKDDEGKSVLIIKAQFAKTAAAAPQDSTEQNGSGESGSGVSGQSQTASSEKDTSDGKNASESKNTSDGKNASGNKNASGSGNASSAKTGGNSSAKNADSGSGEASDSADASQELYSAGETVVCSIAGQDQMKVSVNVDELDILSVQEGQEATVSLDALEDQEFAGTISKISAAASGDGGSAKYPVEITLEKVDGMRQGMSASATIQVEKSENALLIPVAALQERGNTTFVYTEKDEEGNLSGEKEVETGLSDGTRAEILSGLEEGTTVYYLRNGDSDETGNMRGFLPDQMPGQERMQPGSGAPSGKDPSFERSGEQKGGRERREGTQ